MPPPKSMLNAMDVRRLAGNTDPLGGFHQRQSQDRRVFCQFRFGLGTLPGLPVLKPPVTGLAATGRTGVGTPLEPMGTVRCCRFDGRWNGLFSRVLEAFELSGGEVV
jgi:hypothetical protein